MVHRQAIKDDSHSRDHRVSTYKCRKTLKDYIIHCHLVVVEIHYLAYDENEIRTYSKYRICDLKLDHENVYKRLMLTSKNTF